MNQTLKWMYAAEADGGGLSAWKGPKGWHTPYIECSGYALPTLVHWGAGDLAIRCADWLLTVQNKDGSYNGLDGIPRPFDTSAVIEGLEFMYEHTADARYYRAAENAREWMYGMISPDGYLYDSPASLTPRIYHLRASAIIGNHREMDFWKSRPLIYDRERTHYLAYALEGALNFGETEWAMKYINLSYESGNRLQPFYVDHNWSPYYADFDLCASAQMAILFHRVGLNAERHFAALKHHVHENGGVPQSVSAHGDADGRELLWAAKYYLDATEIFEGVKV